MAEVTNLNIKMDLNLKIKADQLFNEMGMNLTTAVNVFVRQALLERAIPFRIYRGIENVTALKNVQQRREAMQEIRDLLADVDGSSVDLDLIKEERRTARFEHTD